jgi:anti-sigma regulatory factor (Ser/Thr protein kinase)
VSAARRAELHRVAARRPEVVPALREAVVDLASQYLEGDVVDDVALVVSELLTNALRHSSSESDITVDAANEEGRFVVTVENLVGAVRPPPTRAWRIAGSTALRGRGLGIVRVLAPEIALSNDDHRVVISVAWPTIS